MIILDTNVISEMMKNNRARQVVAWLRRQPALEIYTTAVTVAEVMVGIAVLPAGRRRDDLIEAAGLMFGRVLQERVLPFDHFAANAYAEIVASRRSQGKPIKELDGQIAAIARSREMAVATRDVGDFVDCGIQVIDPWAG